MINKTIKEIVLEVEKGQDLCDFKELEQIEIYNITDCYEPRKLCFNYVVVKHIPTEKFYQFKEDIHAGITYFDGEVELKQMWFIKNNKLLGLNGALAKAMLEGNWDAIEFD